MTSEQGKVWNGEQLRAGPIAIMLVNDSANNGHVVAVSAEPDAVFLLDVPGLARFLVRHCDRRLICHDAAALHWGLHEALIGATEAVNCLWQFSAEYRLRDVMLLDQRIRLAETGRFSPPRRLQELCSDHCEEGDLTCCHPRGQLRALLRIYKALRRRASVIFEKAAPSARPEPPLPDMGSFGFDLEKRTFVGALPDLPDFDSLQAMTIERRREHREDLIRSTRCFGPLGIGLDVQGAIAMHQASRTGIRVDERGAKNLWQQCNRVYRESSRALWQERAVARECFEWHENYVRLDGKGAPKANKTKLRGWLKHRLDSNPDLRHAPRKPPLDSQGQISLWPGDWGILMRCDPLLRAWANLYAAADGLRFAASGPSTINPRYRIIPEIRLTFPGLAAIRRLAPDSFVPRNEHVFVVGEIPDLELRCFSLICDRLAGQPTPFAQSYRGERGDVRDPVSEAAEKLYDAFVGDEAPNMPEEGWVTRARKKGRTSWFAGFDARSTREAITRHLVRGVCVGLSVRQITELLKAELPQLAPPGEADVDLLVNLLLADACPEWQAIVEDPTVDVVIEKLGISYRTFRDHFDSPGQTEPFSLRNVLAGGKSAPQIAKKLEKLAQDSPDQAIRERARQITGSQDAYDWLLTTNAFSPLGQVGEPIYWPQRRSAEAMLLADAVLKAILFCLVRNGFRLVAAGPDYFVTETPGSSCDEAANKAAALANGAAEFFLGRIARGCCNCEPAERW